MGLVLEWVFSVNRWYVVLALMATMVINAGIAAVRRTDRRYPGIYRTGLISVSISGVLVTFVVTAGVVRVSPWYDPRYLIPLMGMILGNALNGISLCLDRIMADLDHRRAEVEAWLALGATAWEATRPIVAEAVRTGMIPILNSMTVAGIVEPPGDDDRPDPRRRRPDDRGDLPDRGDVHDRRGGEPGVALGGAGGLPAPGDPAAPARGPQAAPASTALDTGRPAPDDPAVRALVPALVLLLLGGCGPSSELVAVAIAAHRNGAGDTEIRASVIAVDAGKHSADAAVAGRRDLGEPGPRGPHPPPGLPEDRRRPPGSSLTGFKLLDTGSPSLKTADGKHVASLNTATPAAGNGTTYAGTFSLTDMPFTAGDSYTVTAGGGGDGPAFGAKIQSPPDFDVQKIGFASTGPGTLSIPSESDLEVDWTPGGGGGEMWIVIHVQDIGPGLPRGRHRELRHLPGSRGPAPQGHRDPHRRALLPGRLPHRAPTPAATSSPAGSGSPSSGSTRSRSSSGSPARPPVPRPPRPRSSGVPLVTRRRSIGDSSPDFEPSAAARRSRRPQAQPDRRRSIS